MWSADLTQGGTACSEDAKMKGMQDDMGQDQDGA